MIPFFAFPPEIRKVIYTTNAIESINATLRKVTRKRGAFPNPDSARKVLYLAIQKASEHWARPIRDWVAALNHFTMVFEGGLPLVTAKAFDAQAHLLERWGAILDFERIPGQPRW